MPKNEVRLFVRAEDRTQQGLDKAQGRLRQFAQEQRQAFTEGAAKFLAAASAVEGGVKLLTAGVKAFKGDVDGALDTLEQLPAGIGPVVAAIRNLAKELSGAAENARLLQEVIRQTELQETVETRARRAREDLLLFRAPQGRRAEIAIRQQQARALQELSRRQFEESVGLEGAEFDRIRRFQRQEFDAVNQLFAERLTKAQEDAAVAGAKAFTEEMKRRRVELVAEFSAIADEAERRIQIRRDLFNFRLSRQEGDLFNRDPGVAGADALLLRGGGVAGLPSGAAAKFLTGAAEAARERNARQQLDELRGIREGIDDLRDVVADQAERGPALNLTVGVFGGQA